MCLFYFTASTTDNSKGGYDCVMFFSRNIPIYHITTLLLLEHHQEFLSMEVRLGILVMRLVMRRPGNCPSENLIYSLYIPGMR